MKMFEILNETDIDLFGYDYMDAEKAGLTFIKHLVPTEGSKARQIIDKTRIRQVNTNIEKADKAISGLTNIPSQPDISSEKVGHITLGLLALYKYFKTLGVFDYIYNGRQTTAEFEDRKKMLNSLNSYYTLLTDSKNVILKSDQNQVQAKETDNNQQTAQAQQQTISQNINQKVTDNITTNSKKSSDKPAKSNKSQSKTQTKKSTKPVDINAMPKTTGELKIVDSKDSPIKYLGKASDYKNAMEILNKIFSYKNRKGEMVCALAGSKAFRAIESKIHYNNNLSDQEKETLYSYIKGIAASKNVEYEHYQSSSSGSDKKPAVSKTVEPTLEEKTKNKNIRKEMVVEIKDIVDKIAAPLAKTLSVQIESLNLSKNPNNITAVPAIYNKLKKDIEDARKNFDDIKNSLKKKSITLSKDEDGISLEQYESRLKDAEKEFETEVKNQKPILEKSGITLNKKEEDSSTKKADEVNQKVTDKIERVNNPSSALTSQERRDIIDFMDIARDEMDGFESKDDTVEIDQYIKDLEDMIKNKKLDNDIKNVIDEFKEDAENKKKELEEK